MRPIDRVRGFLALPLALGLAASWPQPAHARGGHGGHGGHHATGHGGGSGPGRRDPRWSGGAPVYRVYPATGPIFPPQPLIPERLPEARLQQFFGRLLHRPPRW